MGVQCGRGMERDTGTLNIFAMKKNNFKHGKGLTSEIKHGTGVEGHDPENQQHVNRKRGTGGGESVTERRKKRRNTQKYL